jgi:putative colanic acid biosynthesis UDP-glucose lipid carrier transferase
MTSAKNHSILSIKSIVAAGDFIILNLCFILAFFLYEKKLTPEINLWTEGRMFFILINLAYAISLSYVGIILDKRTVFIENILGRVTKTIALHFLITFSSLIIAKSSALPFLFWVLFSSLLFGAISCWRIFARLTLKQYRKKGRNFQRIIILGAGKVANEVYQSIAANAAYGYKFMGFFDDRNPKEYIVDENLVKGKIEDVPEFAKNNRIDEIVCALPAGEDRKAIPIIKFAEQNLIRCYIVPDFKRFLTQKINLSFMEDIPIVSLIEEPLQNIPNKFIKRVFDIVFSFIFLITIFPVLFIILGIAIKLSSSGPVLFKQKRTGKKNREFGCLKFRTMKVNEDADLIQATKNDDRITKVGAFMRKTNLDEIPQFLNVLLGQMSIVGPRPHMLKHTEMYSQLIDKYMVRHFAKPGITGWAQVTGYRGETKELADMEGRIKKDMWYIENWTFWLDMKIIYLTIRNMIKGEKNAY